MERVNYGVKSCCELIRDLYLLISWGKNLSRILSRSLCACAKHCLSIRMCTQCWTQKQDENSILCIVTKKKLCKFIIQDQLQQSLQFMSCLCSCHWMFKLRTGYDDQDWLRKTNSRIEFWKSGFKMTVLNPKVLFREWLLFCILAMFYCLHEFPSSLHCLLGDISIMVFSQYLEFLDIKGNCLVLCKCSRKLWPDFRCER